ncbi:unnamed protein product, partial [Discosporangium mesarthrocarpum]
MAPVYRLLGSLTRAVLCLPGPKEREREEEEKEEEQQQGARSERFRPTPWKRLKPALRQKMRWRPPLQELRAARHPCQEPTSSKLPGLPSLQQLQQQPPHHHDRCYQHRGMVRDEGG